MLPREKAGQLCDPEKQSRFLSVIKKGGVAVIGVYTLPELGGQIERSTGIKAQVCMVQNGDVLNGKKQASRSGF